MPAPDNDDIMISLGELVVLRANLATCSPNPVPKDITDALTKIDTHILELTNRLNFTTESKTS